MNEVVSKAMAVRRASFKLANITTKAKNTALLKIASEISKHKKELLRANAEDVGDAERLLERGKLSKGVRSEAKAR